MRPLRFPALADARAIIAVSLLVSKTKVMAKPFLISESVPAGGHAVSLVLTKTDEPMRTAITIAAAARKVQIPSFMFGTCVKGQLTTCESSGTVNVSLL